MYVTRRLSHYKKFPECLSLPPDGLNSGYLVIQDEEAYTYNCFGLCKNSSLTTLPFPQNKKLTIHKPSVNVDGFQDIVFIPVLNQPLSCNQYYAIEPHGSLGKRKGEGYYSLMEEDVVCRHCKSTKTITDAMTKPLDVHDVYQQFEIVLRGRTNNGATVFTANSVAHGGFPPSFLRMEYLRIFMTSSRKYELGEASGLDSALRARHPNIDIPVSGKCSKVVKVGMWYCPFMFIKEETLAYQIKKSMYYEMTLEQRREQIFATKNDHINGNAVMINAYVQTEVVLVGDGEDVCDAKNVVDKAIWFKGVGSDGEDTSVGLSLEIVERMKWEEERVGWVSGEERKVSVNRVEEFKGGAEGWRKFGCYILVERFVLKRMDGSLVIDKSKSSP